MNVATGALMSETTYTAGVPKDINLIMLSSYSLQLRVLLTDTRTQLAKERCYLSKAVQLKLSPACYRIRDLCYDLSVCILN